jgi:DNA-binding transcriptional LysR family regulator
MKRLALLGHGVAILNRIDVDEQRRLGKLVFVPLRDPRFEYQVLMVAHRARGMLDPLTNVLVERLSAFTRGFGTDVQ